MHRFVVLVHDFPFVHWDFMLEKEAALRTWRLCQPPADRVSIRAEPLPDHRLAYLDYEGAVSGDRGTVTRFDRGTFTMISETDESIEVRLAGVLLHGTATIVRNAAGEEWVFEFTPQSS